MKFLATVAAGELLLITSSTSMFFDMDKVATVSCSIVNQHSSFGVSYALTRELLRTRM